MVVAGLPAKPGTAAPLAMLRNSCVEALEGPAPWGVKVTLTRGALRRVLFLRPMGSWGPRMLKEFGESRALQLVFVWASK
jgi:hypothetical protein